MGGWSHFLNQVSLPWVLSLVLHALTLLLFHWSVLVPIFPQEAVEVELVILLPGVGGASPFQGEGREVKKGVDPALPPRRKATPSLSPQKSRGAPAPLPAATVAPVLESPLIDQRPGSSPLEPGPPLSSSGIASEGSEMGETTLSSGGGEQEGGGRTAMGRGDGLGGGRGSVGHGEGGKGSSGLLLALLRRIEEAKRYPHEARRWGMEGTVEVEFRIGVDGSVEGVTVVKSSGFPLLDEASVATIKRAAPLPIVPGTIRIPISYRLRDGQ